MFSENNTHTDEHYDLRVAGSFKIGRSPLCNVILKDGHVSKVHCSFNICNKDDSSLSVGSKSQVLVSDHSSNGTWISSKGSEETIKLEQGKPTLLKEGDIIFLTRSTAASPDVITYKYCSFPFPRITKIFYSPGQPLHEQNAGVLECQTENDIKDDKTSPSIHLKRKLESDGQFISPRKVRFKEQIEKSIDNHESLIGNSVKSVENLSVSAEGSSTKKRSNPTIHADKSTTLENVATTGDNEDKFITDSNISPSHVSTSSSTESPSGIPEVIKSNKKCGSRQEEDITKRSECDQASGFSASEDDIHHDKCTLCGKWIPHVTASLHDAVCEGQSQEAKSEDHVSLSSAPFENYPIREESNPDIQSPEKLLTIGEENGIGVRNGVSEQDTIGEVNSSDRDPDRIQDETCEKKILKTPTTLPSASCHLSGKSTNSETTSTSSKKDTIGEVNSSDRDPDRIQDETCEKKILKTLTTLSSASCYLSGKSTNSETISTSSKQNAIGEVNSGDRDLDRVQDETCEKKILKTPTASPSASCHLSRKSTNSDTINTSTDTVCEANENVEESTVTKIPTSTPEQHEPLQCSNNEDAGSTSPHEGEPMLEREESKERCTFCTKVLPVSELISHASECSKMSAVFPADSDDTENMHEACPYCGKYFEVLELVEHVTSCKDLSRIKAEAALLEDDFTSSPELEGSDIVEDPSVIDSELCPKCRREFPLLELLKHATECKQEEPLSTASYVESPQEDTSDRLEANNADGSKATVRSSDDICGSCDDLDRDKNELNDEVCSSDVTWGDKDNPIARTEHDVDSGSASNDIEVDEGGGDRKDEEDKVHDEENDGDNDADVEDDDDSCRRRDTGDDDVMHADVYHEDDHSSDKSSLSSGSRKDFKDSEEELDEKYGESSTVSDSYSKSGASDDDCFDDDDSIRRRDTSEEDVTHGDGYSDVDHNSDESSLSNESKEDFKDNEDDLDEKYGKTSTHSDCDSNSGGRVDDCVDTAKNSEDDVGSDEFEFCPNCRELFHLSLLVEHASNCLKRDPLHGIKTSESEMLTGFGKSASFDPAAASSFVFSDCHFCGIRLPVHVLSIHYPKCEKLHLERGSSGGLSRLKESNPAEGLPGHTSHIDNSSSRITIKDDRSTKRPIGLTKTSDSERPSTSSKSKIARFHAAAATVVPPPSAATADDDDDRKASESVFKRTTSSLDSYHDCEEQCMYCLKMFPVSVLVEHACNCTGRQESSADTSSELEQCCYCLRAFPLNELIDHAQNCEQKTVSSSQDGSQDDVIANSQSETGEVLERCMYCFKDFPVSKLIRHSQKCDGDMSGPRERFQGFLPSVHDLSAVSSVAILNDTQRAALQYVITRSAQDSKSVASKLLARVQRLGYTENDLKRTLQWVRSAAPIIIHINLDRVLKFLVKDTHYRNRFETGTSGGSTDKVARKSWEDRIFNKAYHSSIPSERVKYGVLNIVGDPRGVRSCIHYGDSFLQLKKVRLRATFASMDTSGAGVKLSCCEHYENVLFSYTNREITAIMDVATGKVPFHRSDCILHYKEVQIHGPVSLSENVECIVVNARHQGDPRTTSLLDRFVEQNKCNLIWMDPDDYAGAAPHFGMVPGFTAGAAPIFGMGTGLTAGAMGAAPFYTSDTLDRLRSLSDSLSHPARRGRGRGRSKSRRKHPY